MDFLLAGVIVGAVGDAVLQRVVPTYGNQRMKNAFMPYFEKWGEGPSIIAAAGLTGGVSYALSFLNPSPIEFLIMTTFVDDFYREYHPWIYPTLDTYYDNYDRYSTRLYNLATGALILGVKNKL